MSDHVDLSLTEDEAWMVYDLVTAKAEAYHKAELEAMQGLGGQPWGVLQRKVRAQIFTSHSQRGSDE